MNPSDGAPDRPFCSDLSQQAHEPLIATATPTTTFLLVEYNGAWGEKAFEDSQIPDDVKQHLTAYTRTRPDSKLLLLRSPRSQAEPGVRFLAAQLGEGPAKIYDFHVERYEDLLQVRLEDLFDGSEPYAGQRRLAPVYLVCTHGRRDRCCSRAGIPVYTALQEAARPDDRRMGVWQCSHVGGHRFAANLICLSSGLLYGRLLAQDVGALLAAEQQGEVLLEHLRGRLCYPQPAQAAETALRRQTGVMKLDAFHLESLAEDGPNVWTANFVEAMGRRYAVRVRAMRSATRVYESCTLDKTTAPVEYACEVAQWV